MFPGSVLERQALEKSMGDSEVIFHCAYGNTSDPELNRRVNEEGLQNLGEIALSKGIQRLIHFSTVAVYGPQPPDHVTEETPTCLSEDEYGNSKIRTETICRELAVAGLPVVVIRPTVVYGPFSPIWTIGAIKRVLSGGWENTGNIHGLCNPVYIDDLVDGVFLCVDKDGAVGQTFILSGANPVPWNTFFGAYKALASGGKEQFALPSTSESLLLAWMRHLLRRQVQTLRKHMEPQLIELHEYLKMTRPALTGRLLALVSGGIQESEKVKYNQKTVFSIDKASHLLGYTPRRFEEGMKTTADWLRYYEYI